MTPNKFYEVVFRNRLTAAGLAGFFAGLLDGLAAIGQHLLQGGHQPGIIFRFIASGIFGRAAFSGGTNMIAWGILFHFLIAYLFALFYFLVYPFVPILQKRVIITAVLYGLFTWAVMNGVVLPVSRTPPLPFYPGKALVAALILTVCVGLPVSLLAHKYYLYKKNKISDVTSEPAA